MVELLSALVMTHILVSAIAEDVSGQQTPTVVEAQFVFNAVTCVYVAPIAGDVLNKKGQRVVPAGPEMRLGPPASARPYRG